ncbi:pyridine nucleotide-disulfide oxidoreductase [Lysobacteraceae bacterium NML91-0213]|nr:pyridine nucleotide-disulfide oxidoreductase [Xanthomonadaceae bacterium NML91-0213]
MPDAACRRPPRRAVDGILRGPQHRPGTALTTSSACHVDVAILGGGASGALVAAHLLDRVDGAPSVALVEPRAVLARGAAYSTARGEHLLNVRAGGMSAFNADPTHFVAWLQRQRAHADAGAAALASRFMPRREYGAYLEALLESAPGAARLQRVAAMAAGITPVAAGYRIRLADGGHVDARMVVLAIGNLAAPLPLPLAGADALGVGQVVEAWDYEAVAAIDGDADVCIVGAGLSMVDALLTLHAGDHRGRITALSRNGLLPLAHAVAAPAAGDWTALLPLGVRGRLRALRDWARHEAAAGRPWQGVLDALRPHVQALWTAWPEAEQRRFLRHAVRQWDIHRHRIAPEAAAVVASLAAEGRFVLHAGRARALEVGPRPRILYRRREDGSDAVIDADVVVNATGMEKRITRARSPLLQDLLAQGLARPGPHGIGIDTGVDGALFDRDGRPLPGLWTLGALRAGSLWESIAMPELRGQALQVADAVHARLATPSR